MKNIGSVLATGILVAAAGLGCGGGNKEAAGPVTSGGGSTNGVTTHVDVAAQKLARVSVILDHQHERRVGVFFVVLVEVDLLDLQACQ